MTELEILQIKIEELKDELQSARNYTYVSNTCDLYVSNGELYITYGNDCDKQLVLDVNSIFEDLPFIINQVVKEQKKQQKNKIKEIKNALKN